MKERLPRTFRSEAIHEWYHGLENPETPHPHFLLGVLLTSFTSHGGLPWLCQHWAPFLNAADESLGYITHKNGALLTTNFQPMLVNYLIFVKGWPVSVIGTYVSSKYLFNNDVDN